VGEAGSFADVSDEHWARSFEINLMGCVRMCRAFIPAMEAQGEAAIVNTGSDLAKQPEPGLMDYGVCKAGLLYLTKARQTVCAAGSGQCRASGACLDAHVDKTRRHCRPAGPAIRSRGRNAAVKRFFEDRHLPLGIGQAEDAAKAVVFLASPLAKFITGAALDIGGTLRGLI
jgi:NAD(P)-dependent dehydrogenase (short-subunit alcohol dehydrogenase family)